MLVKNQTSFIIVTAIAVGLNFFRLHFGLGGADEAYYYLTAYRLSSGDRILVDVWEHQFSALFTAPLIYIFQMVTGSLDGIILFLREAYLLFTIILLISLRKRLELLTNNSSSWYLTILMLLFCPWSLATFSYNTLSLLFLYSSFIFSASELIAPQQSDSKFSFVISGICAGLSVIAYPVYVIVAVLYMLCIYFACTITHSDRGIRSVLEYFFGLSFVGLTMIGYLVLNVGGIEALWVKLSLLFGTYSGIPMGRGIQKLAGYWVIIIDAAVYLSATLFSFVAISLLTKTRKYDFGRHPKILFAGICGASLLLIGISIEFSKNFLLLNKISLTIFFLTLFIFCIAQKKRWELVLLFLAPSVVTLLLTLAGSWMAADWRTYILFIALPMPFILLKDASLTPTLGNYIEKGVKIFTFILMGGLLVSNYSYVYAEKTIYHLTSKIPFGPYKGIYVSEGTYQEVVYLNDALNKWIRPGDFVATWAISPLAYALAPGKICAPSVWWGLGGQFNSDGVIKSPYDLDSRCHFTKIVEIRSIDSGQSNPTLTPPQFNEIFNENYNELVMKIYEKAKSIN
jgi:hypothetical protein